jgi:hypothetical protein
MQEKTASRIIPIEEYKYTNNFHPDSDIPDRSLPSDRAWREKDDSDIIQREHWVAIVSLNLHKAEDDLEVI